MFWHDTIDMVVMVFLVLVLLLWWCCHRGVVAGARCDVNVVDYSIDCCC